MAKKSSPFVPPSECPVCGAAVPPSARACPDCGADERTGWNEETTRYDGLDLPDEAFDEDPPGEKISRRKFRPAGVPLFWWAVGICITLLITYLVATAHF